MSTHDPVINAVATIEKYKPGFKPQIAMIFRLWFRTSCRSA